jgi:hypothetical protein
MLLVSCSFNEADLARKSVFLRWPRRFISPGVAPRLHGFVQRESGNPRKGGEEWHFQIVVMEQAFVGTGSKGPKRLSCCAEKACPKTTPHNRPFLPHLPKVSKLKSSRDVALYHNFHGVALHCTSQIPVEGYLVFVQESMANRDRFCAMHTDIMIPNLTWGRIALHSREVIYCILLWPERFP